MTNSKAITRDIRQIRCLQTLLVLILLSVFISTAQAKDKRWPGEMIDVGTHKMHINCIGEGSPSVIIDSGIGGFSLEWIRIQNNLAEDVRICSYDRAGYGWSEPGPKPRTTAQISFELKKLLTEANIPGPYLMVGHSFGGYNIRYFANLFPDEVAGMVFVDASHPEQFNTEEFKRVRKEAETKQFKRKNSFSVRTIRPVIANNFPAENKRTAYMLMLTLKSKMTLIDELDNMEFSAQELNRHEELGNYHFPVVVITRGKRVWPHTDMGDRREQQWLWLQSDLNNISSQSYHFIARNSGHIVHLDEPELVSTNIMFALERARTYQKQREMMEKYNIRLAHYGTIESPASLYSNYMNKSRPDNDFFAMNKNFQRVLFDTEINQVKKLSDSPIF